MKFCPVCKRNWEDDFRVCPIDGLPLQEVAGETDPYVGQTLGQARVTEKIADGDMGPVYRAEDPTRGVLAAQFIASEKLQSTVLVEAFEDAVKLAAKVNHPNVIRVYSMERTQDGQTAVLMEYVDGISLDEYRQKNPLLDVQQACRIVKEAGDGIQAAHRISMLHGALQPSRILVAADGKVKIGGFHRSGFRDDAVSQSSGLTDFIYMSPERSGTIQDMAMPDYRADIYSLGIILYELLTGKLPYEVKSAAELGVAMEAKPPLPPSMSNPQVSPTLSRVVLKAISKHPGDRQRSAEEFVHEIEAARQPIQPPGLEASPQPWPTPQTASNQDMGLFPPGPDSSKKPQAENIWPEPANEKPAGEGTFFGWFKTQVGGRLKSRDRGPIRTTEDSSVYPGSMPSHSADEFEGRTVVVPSRRGRSRRRSIADTFAGFRGKSYSDDQDFTAVDTLPHRRFFSKPYILMAVGGVVLIAAIMAWFLIFRSPATGKVKVESEPSGARVALNNEYIGTTPLYTEKPAGAYRLRLELDGYESATADLDIGSNSDIQRFFTLKPQAILPVDDQQIPQTILPPPILPPLADEPKPEKTRFEGLLSKAIASRNFFPPASGNAWEILQSWKTSEGVTPTPAWERARQNFCGELEILGGEKLDQRDYKFVRGLLDQTRNLMPGQACVERLQDRFNTTISRSINELRSSLNAAMARQNYVTPESDNALKYVKLILNLDSQDVEAKTLEGDIYSRALDQAKAKSKARLHQEALDIYTQLKSKYPSPPGGVEILNRGIEQEKTKLSLLTALKEVYVVQVKHGHGIFRGSCQGNLRVDGFNIEFQSDGGHSFKIPYDRLQSITFNKGKITIKSGDIDDGKIELEQLDKNPSPSLAEVYQKIEEYRKLREQYSRP
jgi:serine/threonine protein kinase/tetratricopeptide (TPR) repeat protein